MNREEKIMKRVQEHYDYLQSKGYEIVFLALQPLQSCILPVKLILTSPLFLSHFVLLPLFFPDIVDMLERG